MCRPTISMHQPPLEITESLFWRTTWAHLYTLVWLIQHCSLDHNRTIDNYISSQMERADNFRRRSCQNLQYLFSSSINWWAFSSIRWNRSSCRGCSVAILGIQSLLFRGSFNPQRQITCCSSICCRRTLRTCTTTTVGSSFQRRQSKDHIIFRQAVVWTDR